MTEPDGTSSGTSAPSAKPVAGTVTGVALDRAVTVTFTAPRALTDDDVAAIRRAGRVLLDELRVRGLTPAPMHDPRRT